MPSPCSLDLDFAPWRISGVVYGTLLNDPASLAAIGGVQIVGTEGTTVRLSCPEHAMDALVKRAAEHSIVDLVSQPADLEEIFLAMYRDGDDGD
jgi:hypothetical protein